MAAEQAAAPVQVEKQTNCLSCNKPIKKIRQYYREGKYYCTKRCWVTYRKQQKEKAQETGK